MRILMLAVVAALLNAPAAQAAERIMLHPEARGLEAVELFVEEPKDERITALILMAGLYDLEEFYPSGDEYLDENIVNETGATPEAFADRAALRYAEKITAATLILHGEGDTRGRSLDQAERLAAKLEAN